MWLEATVNDTAWSELGADERAALLSERATYLERRSAPNKLKPYPPFEELYGVLSADIIVDAFKRRFAARYVRCCVELQNSSTSRCEWRERRGWYEWRDEERNTTRASLRYQQRLESLQEARCAVCRLS